MNEAEVADHIHDPEVLVAGRGFHDLLGRRNNDEGCVLDLRSDRHDVLRMVGDVAGCSLGMDGHAGQRGEYELLGCASSKLHPVRILNSVES